MAFIGQPLMVIFVLVAAHQVITIAHAALQVQRQCWLASVDDQISFVQVNRNAVHRQKIREGAGTPPLTISAAMSGGRRSEHIGAEPSEESSKVHDEPLESHGQHSNMYAHSAQSHVKSFSQDSSQAPQADSVQLPDDVVGENDIVKSWDYGDASQSWGSPALASSSFEDSDIDKADIDSFAVPADSYRNVEAPAQDPPDTKVAEDIFELGRQSAESDFSYGWQSDIATLIQRNGVLHGVTLLAGNYEAVRREVLHIRPTVANLPEDEQQRAMLFNADTSTMEGSISSIHGSCIERTNQIITKFGTSAFSSISLGKALSGCSSFGSEGLNFGSSDATSQVAIDEYRTDEEVRASQQAQAFTKTVYELEPRAILAIRPWHVVPSKRFLSSVNGISLDTGGQTESVLLSQYTIQELFKDYGTHVCTKVALGGWQRHTASYRSDSNESSRGMDKIVSDVLAQSGITKDELGERVDSGPTFYSSPSGGIIEVRNEWKGGISGSTLVQFRASLSECKSSNWRVIDRNVEQCRGIWYWVQSPEHRMAICKEWVKQIVKAMNVSVPSTIWVESCGRGSGTVQEFLELLAQPRSQASQTTLPTLARAVPAAMPAPTIVGTSASGMSTPAPTISTTAMLSSTEAMIGTSSAWANIQTPVTTIATPVPSSTEARAVPPKGPPPGTVGTTMAPTPSLQVAANVFTLSVRTRQVVGCGTNASVYALVDDGSGSLEGDIFGKSTGWQLLDLQDHTDFLRGGEDDYAIAVPSQIAFIPARVCFKTIGTWCPDDVCVYDGLKLKGFDSEYGTTSSFAQIHSQMPQCRPITPGR